MNNKFKCATWFWPKLENAIRDYIDLNPGATGIKHKEQDGFWVVWH